MAAVHRCNRSRLRLLRPRQSPHKRPDRRKTTCDVPVWAEEGHGFHHNDASTLWKNYAFANSLAEGLGQWRIHRCSCIAVRKRSWAVGCSRRSQCWRRGYGFGSRIVAGSLLGKMGSDEATALARGYSRCRSYSKDHLPVGECLSMENRSGSCWTKSIDVRLTPRDALCVVLDRMLRSPP